MKKISLLLLLLLTLVLVGGGCFGKKAEETAPEGTVEIDRDAILFDARENGLIMTLVEVMAMSSIEPITAAGATNQMNIEIYLDSDKKGWSSAALADVTGGESYGLAHATFENGVFTLVAELGNLTEPTERFSYQGWVVKRGDEMTLVNLGSAVKTETGYALVFTSSQDLSDYNFFVLTLETLDGLSSAEEHILEGSFR